MIQLNRIQLTSQTPNHVKMTEILSTSQRESRIIDCLLVPAWNMLRPRQIKLTVTKHGFLHVYKPTTCLASLVSKNCLGKQFTNKFLGTSETNRSLKNVLCSKSILIIVQ